MSSARRPASTRLAAAHGAVPVERGGQRPRRGQHGHVLVRRLLGHAGVPVAPTRIRRSRRASSARSTSSAFPSCQNRWMYPERSRCSGSARYAAVNAVGCGTETAVSDAPGRGATRPAPSRRWRPSRARRRRRPVRPAPSSDQPSPAPARAARRNRRPRAGRRGVAELVGGVAAESGAGQQRRDRGPRQRRLRKAVQQEHRPAVLRPDAPTSKVRSPTSTRRQLTRHGCTLAGRWGPHRIRQRRPGEQSRARLRDRTPRRPARRPGRLAADPVDLGRPRARRRRRGERGLAGGGAAPHRLPDGRGLADRRRARRLRRVAQRRPRRAHGPGLRLPRRPAGRPPRPCGCTRRSSRPRVETPEGPELHARGAIDDKGNVAFHLLGMRAHLAATGRATLAVTVKLLIEGRRSRVRRTSPTCCRERRDRLHCDVVVVSDTGMAAPDVPSAVTAMRGLADAEITLRGPEVDLHSGSFGGAVPNPLHARRGCSPVCTTSRGASPCPASTTRSARSATGARADGPGAVRRDGLARRPGRLARDRGRGGFQHPGAGRARPTAEVNGLWGGYTGPGHKTIIPPRRTPS